MSGEGTEMSGAPLPTREDLAAASEIDVDILKRWFEIGDNSHVELIATRSQMDALFLGLRQMLFSQNTTMAALSHFRRGNDEEGDVQFAAAAQTHLQALGNITRWTSAMMAQAKPHE